MNLSFLKIQMLTTQIVSVCIECIAYVLSSTLAKKLTLRKCTNFSPVSKIRSSLFLCLLTIFFTIMLLMNVIFTGPTALPESLVRVQNLTGKTLTFYGADLCNKDSLREVFSKHKIDCVIHFAALKAVGESCRLPLMYYGNNVTGSANLMEVMMDFGVKKIVFSSSATVYGDPEYLPVDEKHPTGKCTNPYGKTKYFMEEIIKDVCSANPDWSSMLLRYFNPVGAHPSGMIGEDPQGIPNNLMPYIAQVAVGRRDKLSVYGGDYPTPDGTGVRDYIHVMDLAIGKHLLGLKITQNVAFSNFGIFYQFLSD